MWDEREEGIWSNSPHEVVQIVLKISRIEVGVVKGNRLHLHLVKITEFPDCWHSWSSGLVSLTLCMMSCFAV